MATLTSRQRAFLRRLAHRLKPVVHVGSEGVTASLLASIEDAFKTRELLKVKVLEAAPDKARTTAGRIVGGLDGVDVVHTIGRTMVLYRPHPESPEIELPVRGGGGGDDVGGGGDDVVL